MFEPKTKPAAQYAMPRRKGVTAIAPYDDTGKISFILYYLPVLHYS